MNKFMYLYVVVLKYKTFPFTENSFVDEKYLMIKGRKYFCTMGTCCNIWRIFNFFKKIIYFFCFIYFAILSILFSTIDGNVSKRKKKVRR